MEEWLIEQKTIMIIGIIVLVAISILFIIISTRKESSKNNKYLSVLNPAATEEQTIENNQKKKLRSKASEYFKKKGTTDKINNWYLRAGYKNKTIRDFIIDGIKWFLIGAVLFALIFILLENIIFAILPALIFIFYPYLNIYSKIKSRESAFINSFPYFLQNIAFVLKNGTNFTTAFYEVTNKQEEGVLKDVMKDVIAIQNIHAGDYKVAFSSILNTIKIQEVSEFVSVIIDNLEKGTSIADTFLNQAENISKMQNLTIKRKIHSASTKILFPILFLLFAVGILFLSL